MPSRLRSIARSILLVSALFTGVSTDATPSASASDSQAALHRSEVRLRKLHLVRPDLIPYPMAYDVYC